MSRIVVSEFVTVDGVMEGPGGPDPSFDRAGWAFGFDRGADGDAFKLEELSAADALLLGRVTYEGFAAAWPSRTDEEGFAGKMNAMRKYVVSKTLTEPAWHNTTVLAGDLPEEIGRLRQQPGGDVLVNGSTQLVQALAAHGLVDEYRLMIFPIVLGAGKRLFGDLESIRLTLAQARPVGPDGVLTAIYHPAA